jgi:hypothetical protein
MPPRSPELPSVFERDVLQLLVSGIWKTRAQLKSPSSATLNKLVAKGWVEFDEMRGFRITDAGRNALRRKLPDVALFPAPITPIHYES